MRQVISVKANGSISGLQHKPGKGIDLRQFGKANITRASEIVWNEMVQKWYVQFIRGPLAGHTLTQDVWERLNMPTPAGEPPELHPVESPIGHELCATVYPTAMFEEYDEAVDAEVAYFNHVRLKDGSMSLDP